MPQVWYTTDRERLIVPAMPMCDADVLGQLAGIERCEERQLPQPGRIHGRTLRCRSVRDTDVPTMTEEVRCATRRPYPVTLSVDYPDRPLNRLTTFLRIFVVIPALVDLGAVAGGTWQQGVDGRTGTVATGVGGLLFAAPLCMIVFRQKYPRWWFDWNLELQRFGNRVVAYLALMDDRYPSTDDQQSVHLDYPYPDAAVDLNRWMPLVKWYLAIPHYVALFFLEIAAFVAVVVAWFAILFTARTPRGLFDFVESVLRWHNRVTAYALVLVTDDYPPFRLSA